MVDGRRDDQAPLSQQGVASDALAIIPEPECPTGESGLPRGGMATRYTSDLAGYALSCLADSWLLRRG